MYIVNAVEILNRIKLGMQLKRRKTSVGVIQMVCEGSETGTAKKVRKHELSKLKGCLSARLEKKMMILQGRKPIVKVRKG